LRIPEQGGLPEPGSDLPRGVLLLQIIPAAEPDSSVKVLGRAPSLHPPKPEPKPVVSTALVGPNVASVPVVAPKSVPPKRRTGAIVAAAIVVVVWILLLIWLRLSGLG
jgi:hypothetical protein